MAANTPPPLHNPARPLSRGDQKNLPNTYGIVTNKIGCAECLSFAKKPSANSPHNVIGFVGDNTNKGRNVIGVDPCRDQKVLIPCFL